MIKFHLKSNLTETPLHKASDGLNFEIVKLLLVNNATTKIQNCRYETPLFKAASKSYESVKAILEKNANIDIMDYI